MQGTVIVTADSTLEFSSGDCFGWVEGGVESAEGFGGPKGVGNYITQLDRAVWLEGEVWGENVGFNGRHFEREGIWLEILVC